MGEAESVTSIGEEVKLDWRFCTEVISHDSKIRFATKQKIVCRYQDKHWRSISRHMQQRHAWVNWSCEIRCVRSTFADDTAGQETACGKTHETDAMRIDPEFIWMLADITQRGEAIRKCLVGSIARRRFELGRFTPHRVQDRACENIVITRCRPRPILQDKCRHAMIRQPLRNLPTFVDQ